MGYQSYPPTKRRAPLRPTDLFNARTVYEAANSPVGRAVLNAGANRIRSAISSFSPVSTMTNTTTMSGLDEHKRMFRPSSDAMQLMKRKMNTRLNKDRNVAMAELYNALYPRRSVVVESSYQMYTGAAQKMTCMNVFRHQDLGVLDKYSSTFKVQSSTPPPADGWPEIIPSCPSSVDPLGFPEDNDGTDVCNVKYNRTVSGYTMRGYGLNVQNAANTDNYPSLQVQGQMYIGPGNHCVWDPVTPGQPTPSPDVGMPTGNDVYGVKDNVDPASYLGVFTNWANDVPVVHYPNLDRKSVSVGDLMGCCQTLWSPICAQSIEAASANLGYNTLGIGTVDSRTGSLDPSGVVKDQSGLDFGPETPERYTNLAKLVPRNELDPVGTHFTWTKHSADYKVTNTYSYPVEVEFIVYKVHGLTSRDQVSATPGASPERFVTEYYPGVNGPLPYTASNGGIFDIFFGGSGPLNGGMVNRSMILDFMSAWQNKVRPSDTPYQGVQLPQSSGLPVTDPLYGQPGVASAPNFQIATKTHWPLTNARWKSFMSPRGCKSPFEFMREFSRKTIKLQSGELASHRIDFGGFKYALEDIGYYSQKGTGTQSFKAFPVYSQTSGTSQIQYANRGMMNGSVVVVVVLKGTTVAANAPIPRTGPNPLFPATKYGGASISAPISNGSSGQAVDFQRRTNLVVDRGEFLDPPGTTVRGNFAAGSVNAAASLLVECKESVEFQPMMNKRPKLLRNTVTHTNKSLLLTASCPVSETVRTIPEPSTDTFSKANTNNNFSKTRTDL